MLEITLKGPNHNYTTPLKTPYIIASKVFVTNANGNVKIYDNFKTNQLTFDDHGLTIKCLNLITDIQGREFINAIGTYMFIGDGHEGHIDFTKLTLEENILYIDYPELIYRHWNLRRKSNAKEGTYVKDLANVRFQFILTELGIAQYNKAKNQFNNADIHN